MANISKRWFRVRDTYGVAVAPGQDDALVLAVPIRLLAVAVAYSRVHTGVHYPGDVVVGSVAGAGTAAMVAAVADRAARARASGRGR